jgi:hypothetical protein
VNSGHEAVSSVSFWRQDQNWLISQLSWDSQITGSNAASAVITSALTRKSSGIAGIFNQEALTRVTNELQTAAAAAVKSLQSGSTSNTSLLPTSAPTGSLGLLPAAPNLASAGTAQSVLSSAISGGTTNPLASLLGGVNLLV